MRRARAKREPFYSRFSKGKYYLHGSKYVVAAKILVCQVTRTMYL